jgi:hypothetical protein
MHKKSLAFFLVLSLFASVFCIDFFVQGNSVTVSGLVLQNTFDATTGTIVEDSSGQGNTGTIIGAGYSWVSGQYSNCLSFASGATYVNYTKNTYTMGLTTKGSFCVWATNGLSNYEAILGDYSGGQGCEIRCGGDGTLKFWVVSGHQLTTNSSYFADNNFHFIVCTYNTTNMCVYRDGVFWSSLTYAATMGNSAATLKVNCRGDLSDGGTQKIDELQIYNRDLTANEVSQLYANDLPPTFGTITLSSLSAGSTTVLSCVVSDTVGVSFSSIATNNTGTIINQTATATSTISYTFTLTTNIGDVLAVQAWANNTWGYSAYSSLTYFTVTAAIGLSVSGDGLPGCNIKSADGLSITYIKTVGP